MRALDPLGYEKETLAHFQTLKVSTIYTHRTVTKCICSAGRLSVLPFLLQEVDSMRSAYYSDLCSKFLIENTILKMEYAEVRVFSISDRVGHEFLISNMKIKWRNKKEKKTSVKRNAEELFLLPCLPEPDNIMPPGPAVISDTHQSVVQSAPAATSSVCHVAVLGGENATTSSLITSSYSGTVCFPCLLLIDYSSGDTYWLPVY